MGRAEVHSTAHVDPAAQLGEDVFVGPFSLVGAGVALGARTRLISHVQIAGPTTLGEDNLIHPFAVVGGPAQMRQSAQPDENEEFGLRIGDGNEFREHVTINRGTWRDTVVGDGNYLMTGSHVGHDVLLGNNCTFANDAALAGHCEVGDQVNFGGAAMAQQGTRIGRLSFIGGLVGVNRDLPPFCMVHRTKAVSSLNLVGLRRSGMRASIDPLRRAFDLLYRHGLPLREAADAIDEAVGDDPACQELIEFVRKADRGVLRYVSKEPARRRLFDAAKDLAPSTDDHDDE
ncbi:MAG: acyl-ACP--UDP-N-acetylglucosamine O-acyltransferase [Planctomycetota bacterium]